MDTYYDDFGITPVDKEFLDKQQIANLFKPVKKDKGVNAPRYNSEIPEDFTHQADLLFLPEDRGYKYVLVVVDVGTRQVDAEPLKTKTSKEVLEAFKTIYGRDILDPPKRIELDPGTEFKGVVQKYFENKGIAMRFGKPGRHQQQAIAERANQSIGTALMKKMTSQELLTGKVGTMWIEGLPVVIKAMNKLAKKRKPVKLPDEPVCAGDACNLIEIGAKVRVKLEEPINIATGTKEIGKFRSGDVKYHPKERTVKDIVIKPGYPPLYLLDGKEPVSYTKNQLQVIPKDEQLPPRKVVPGKATYWIVEKLVERKKINNRIMFKVRWRGYPDVKDTWEPRTVLIEGIPDLVEEFEMKK